MRSLIILLLSLISFSAFSTSFYAQPFEKSVSDAPIIIRGRIGTSESRYSSYNDGSKQLFTFTSVEVKDRMKGADSVENQIQIREIGGEKNGVEMSVSGRAEFSPGEDVVLFLNSKAKDGSYPLKGLMMGKFTIEKDRAGNEILKGPGIDTATHGHVHDESESEKEEPTIWTVKALRTLISENKKITPTPGKAEETIATVGIVASPTPSPPPSSPASEQSTESDRSSLNEGDQSAAKMSLKLLVAILIGGGFYIWKRRRR